MRDMKRHIPADEIVAREGGDLPPANELITRFLSAKKDKEVGLGLQRKNKKDP